MYIYMCIYYDLSCFIMINTINILCCFPRRFLMMVLLLSSSLLLLFLLRQQQQQQQVLFILENVVETYFSFSYNNIHHIINNDHTTTSSSSSSSSIQISSQQPYYHEDTNKNKSNDSIICRIAVKPKLHIIQELIKDSQYPKYYLRDPTSPVYDSKDGKWHIWTTRVKGSNVGGYSGRIYHYVSTNTTSSSIQSTKWIRDDNIAINVSTNPNDFDSFGTFTPSIFYDITTTTTKKKRPPLWYLWYGGVSNNDDDSHNESIGLATSHSPYGPWKKYSNNPVVPWNIHNWCNNINSIDNNNNDNENKKKKNNNGPARVDELEPYVLTKYDNRNKNNNSVERQEVLMIVKTVCNNFTALPVLLKGSSNNSSSSSSSLLFQPPYHIVSIDDDEKGSNIKSEEPLVNAEDTVGKLGFEQARLFYGPDNLLHMIGHNHGNDQHPHFVFDDNNSNNNNDDDDDDYHQEGRKKKKWVSCGFFDTELHEPSVVIPPNQFPGSNKFIPKYFIGFQNGIIYLMNVTWVPAWK